MEVEASQVAEPNVKKSRKRHKHLFQQIRQQMEFYFSDANLHKDRFIKKLIDQSDNGYIELSVFANFNKLRALTDDMSLVAKALGQSNLIEVSEDKQRIKRRLPLCDPKDVDERTVYVECLPLSATHDWVRKIFEVCGTVLYVSLPKYKTSRDIKGFAFVEFETAEMAQKACQLLHNPPAHAADKFGKFPKANKQIRQLENKVRAQKPGDVSGESRDPRLSKSARRQRTVSESAASDSLERVRKRRRTTSEGSDSCHGSKRKAPPARSDSVGSEPEVKRAKTFSTSSDSVDPNDVCQDDNHASTAPSVVGSGTAGDKECVESERDRVEKNASETSPGKSRKRRPESPKGEDDDPVEKKSRVSQVEEPSGVDEETQGSEASQGVETARSKSRSRHRTRKRGAKETNTHKELPELTVIPKRQWSELRSEYLKLQRISMGKLKKTLRQDATEAMDDESHQVPDKQRSHSTKSGQKERADIEFTPNVIVKVRSENELSRKQIKEFASGLGSVAYVDVLDGATEGFVRCNTAPTALKLVEVKCDFCTFHSVEGEEEQSYWDKLKLDRENKLSNKSKTKHRGRDKLFKRAENTQKPQAEQRKHVIFDDD